MQQHNQCDDINTSYVPKFGLYSSDYDWQLLQFIDSDTLSRLPLEDFQIDKLSHLLNWHIISTKELKGWLFHKHRDKIDWLTFLTNGKPKEILWLMQVKDILTKHLYIFYLPQWKQQYYTEDFMVVFPDIVDWNWCATNIQIPEYLILRHWDKFTVDNLCKYQNLSSQIIKLKQYELKWSLLCQKPLKDDILNKYTHLLHWDSVCRYQKLSMDFIENNFMYIKATQQRIDLICKYQTLTEPFMLKYIHILNRAILSEFQLFTIEFINAHKDIFVIDKLLINKHYNDTNTPQIIKHHKTGELWVINRSYIVDSTKNNTIHICQEILEVECVED